MDLERKLQLLEDELRQTRRMATLGELASTTTHEFNNILTTILNYAKLGLRHKDDASREKALNKILSAAVRAEKITNGVLGIARSRGHERTHHLPFESLHQYRSHPRRERDAEPVAWTRGSDHRGHADHRRGGRERADCEDDA